MREIKFRAWDIHQRTWIDLNEYQLLYEDHSFTVTNILDDGFEPLYEEEDFILCQFTGLLDKNGKPIFEGDIVKDLTAWMGYNPFFEVKYFVNDREKANPLYGDVGYNISSGSIYEIIGNIYENPELLWRRVMKSRAEKLDVTTTAIHRLCLHCGKLIIPGRHACEETLKNIEEMGK